MSPEQPRQWRPATSQRPCKEEYAKSEEEAPQEDGEAQAEEEAPQGPSQEEGPLGLLADES